MWVLSSSVSGQKEKHMRARTFVVSAFLALAVRAPRRPSGRAPPRPSRPTSSATGAQGRGAATIRSTSGGTRPTPIGPPSRQRSRPAAIPASSPRCGRRRQVGAVSFGDRTGGRSAGRANDPAARYTRDDRRRHRPADLLRRRRHDVDAKPREGYEVGGDRNGSGQRRHGPRDDDRGGAGQAGRRDRRAIDDYADKPIQLVTVVRKIK